MLSNNVHARYITITYHAQAGCLRSSNILAGRICLMVKKKYSSNVNNQILEQIYMDMLEKLKIEACSVQEHIQ